MLLGLLAPVVGAQESGPHLARHALAICRSVRALPEGQRLARLDEGLALAERAAVDDPNDAVAHFAAFCNRGKRLQIAGIGFRTLGEVRRLRRDIDSTLALAPDWPDALAGKGAMLVALPRIFGGDVVEGEHLLRRALALDPGNIEARIILGELETDAGVAAPAIAKLG